MDLQKLKKEQLIDVIEKQSHLAEAVEAKDLEIEKLKRDIKEIKEKEKVANKELMNGIIEDKEKEVSKLKSKINELEETLRKMPRLEDIQKLVMKDGIINLYKNAYVNLLKTLQGTLDAHIDLETFVQQADNNLKIGGNLNGK